MRTHLRRAETVDSDPSDREVRHVKKALSANGYKKWSFEIPQKEKMGDERVHPVCKSYVVRVLEHLRCMFWARGVVPYYKPFNTLRSQLVTK